MSTSPLKAVIAECETCKTVTFACVTAPQSLTEAQEDIIDMIKAGFTIRTVDYNDSITRRFGVCGCLAGGAS